MKRRNNSLLFVLLTAVVAFGSCKKALEEKPFSFLSPDNFYENGEDAVTAINGVYNVLYSWEMFQQPFWNMTVLDDDHVSGADWYLSSTGAGNPQNYWGVDGPWVGSFQMIARANTVIENVEPMENIEADLKKRVLGEAHFLRGWAYFQLVQLYGGVPIRLSSLGANPESNTPRATVMETYQVVIDELKLAEQLLFPRGSDQAGDLGRATRGAAKAFLAKAYLTIASAAQNSGTITVRGGQDNNLYTYNKQVVEGFESVNAQEYFVLARDKALELIQDQEFNLFADWKSMWHRDNRNKEEHIWMVQSMAGTSFINNLHNYFSAYSSFGRGAVWMTNYHYMDYEDQDKRALEGIRHNYQSNTGYRYYYPSWQSALYQVVNGYTWNNNGNTDNRAYTIKYASVADSTVANSDAFYPLMRYADVYLIYAEAANEASNGPTTEAYFYLNEIRNRVNASDAPANMSRDEFRSYVLAERAREFALEGVRRFDLLRWGIYLDVMNKIGIGQNNISKLRNTRNKLLPIPLGELNSNRAITGNNPGW